MATVASKSAGPGTRQNIDEFTRTTASAVEKIGGAKKGKAIIVINPAEPPLIMRDTVHCLTEDAPKVAQIEASVQADRDKARLTRHEMRSLRHQRKRFLLLFRLDFDEGDLRDRLIVFLDAGHGIAPSDTRKAIRVGPPSWL